MCITKKKKSKKKKKKKKKKNRFYIKMLLFMYELRHIKRLLPFPYLLFELHHEILWLC